ncbi:MAG: hypothetical protein ABL927_02715 [Bdellovibrionales bacterium]
MKHVRANKNVVIITTSLVFLAGLSACSKGGKPAGWTPDNLTKVKCASPLVFNLNAISAKRIEVISQTADEKPAHSIVLRNYVVKDDVAIKGKIDEKAAAQLVQESLGSNAIKSNPSVMTTASAQASQDLGVQVLAQNCAELTTTIMATGLEKPLVGKIKKIESDEIVVVGKDQDGDVQITIKKVKTDSKDDAVKALAKADDARGINTLSIKIERNQKDVKRTTEFVSKTTPNVDEELTLSPSAVRVLVASAGEAILSTPAGKIYLKALAEKSKEMKVKFSELMDLKSAAAALVTPTASNAFQVVQPDASFPSVEASVQPVAVPVATQVEVKAPEATVTSSVVESVNAASAVVAADVKAKK